MTGSIVAFVLTVVVLVAVEVQAMRKRRLRESLMARILITTFLVRLYRCGLALAIESRDVDNIGEGEGQVLRTEIEDDSHPLLDGRIPPELLRTSNEGG
jgi:hypothetical protein